MADNEEINTNKEREIDWRLSTLEAQNQKLEDGIINLTRSVDSLTQAVETMQRSVDRYDNVEQQVRDLQNKTSRLDQMWEQIDTLRLSEAQNKPYKDTLKSLVYLVGAAMLSSISTVSITLLVG